MAEARITEFFGETQIREEVLDFMGFGSCMPREAWKLPSRRPPLMFSEMCVHQRRRRNCRDGLHAQQKTQIHVDQG